MKSTRSSRFILVFALMLAALGTAQASGPMTRQPGLTARPTFACDATATGTLGIAKVTHTNAVAVDKKRLVVATVKTATGTQKTAVCGDAFAAQKTASLQFLVPADADKDWIYTCSAQVGDECSSGGINGPYD